MTHGIDNKSFEEFTAGKLHFILDSSFENIRERISDIFKKPERFDFANFKYKNKISIFAAVNEPVFEYTDYAKDGYSGNERCEELKRVTDADSFVVNYDTEELKNITNTPSEFITLLGGYSVRFETEIYDLTICKNNNNIIAIFGNQITMEKIIGNKMKML